MSNTATRQLMFLNSSMYLPCSTKLNYHQRTVCAECDNRTIDISYKLISSLYLRTEREKASGSDEITPEILKYLRL